MFFITVFYKECIGETDRFKLTDTASSYSNEYY